MIPSLILSFVAGLITMFNPCVLPLAPIIIAGARAEDTRAPIALAAGLAVSFGVTGALVVYLGSEIGDVAAIRLPASLLMIPIGLALAVPMVGHWAEVIFRPSAAMPQAGLLGNFLIGALMALVWAPCVGPTLGAAIVLASQGGSLPLAMLNMMIYALGTATSLLLAGYLLRKVAASGKRLAGRTAFAGRVAFGVLLVTIGVLTSTGLDQRIEGTIDNHLPDWFIGVVTRL